MYKNKTRYKATKLFPFNTVMIKRKYVPSKM